MNLVVRGARRLRRQLGVQSADEINSRRIADGVHQATGRAEGTMKELTDNQSHKLLVRVLQASRGANIAAIELQRLQYLALHKEDAIKPLACFSESAFSQNGEDGVIAEIFRRLGRPCRTFIEIGAGDGTENNTIALLLGGATGIWVEAGEKEAASIQTHHAEAIAGKQLTLLTDRVTAENVNSLIQGLSDPDLISIDIDGNDFWVFKSIMAQPALFIVEYNASYGSSLSWTMKYNPEHVWAGGNGYYGASLKALEKLGTEKGYTLVGVDFMGVNAFFVRNDLVGDRFPGPHTSEAMFQPFRRGVASMLKGKAPVFGPYVNP
jgi:hypothetical protein